MKKHSEHVAKIMDVAQIIKNPVADTLLEQDCRRMLLAALPHALGVSKDKRDGVQQGTVTAVGELMLKIFDHMVTAMTAGNTVVTVSEKMMADQATKVGIAARELVRVQAGGAACLQAVQSLRNCMQASEQRLRHCMQTPAEQRLRHCMQTPASDSQCFDLAVLEAAKASCFRKLVAGDFGDATPEMLYQSLEPSLLLLEIDSSLRVAAKHALLARANKRTSFQNHVVQELEKSFTLQIQKLCDNIAYINRVQERDEANKRLLVSKLAKDRVNFEAATEDLRVHQAYVKNVQQHLALAKEVFDVYQLDCQKAKEVRAIQKTTLLDFVYENMMSFYALADGVPDTTVPDMAHVRGFLPLCDEQHESARPAAAPG